MIHLLMGVLMWLFLVMGGAVLFVGGIAISVWVEQEIRGSTPVMLKRLVSASVLLIPASERERYRHDWLVDLENFAEQYRDRPLSGFFWALGCFRAAAIEGWDLRKREASVVSPEQPHIEGDVPRRPLSALERKLLGELLATVAEHEQGSAPTVDRARLQDAFACACEYHAGRQRVDGEELIVRPVGVAAICASVGLDTETLCAALLYDSIAVSAASIDDIRVRFGDEVAVIAQDVTRLNRITFQSGDDTQADNYRNMIMAMATDVRVIMINLADRLYSMRTIGTASKEAQTEKARETLEVYAPLAHRLGVHAIRWELEDLAFEVLKPRKYHEIRTLVAQQRDERERYVDGAGEYLRGELASVGIEAEIVGRAKHLYAIYSKMTKQGREFNEIYDLTAMRVIVDSVRACYGTVGVIHALWKPLPGRFKDFVALPKSNNYQSLHTTVIGPEGRPLEIQVRTKEMHEIAEFGIASRWREGQWSTVGEGSTEGDSGLDSMQPSLGLDDERRAQRVEESIFVLTPKGQIIALAAGATPLDFAYQVHTEVGHRCVGVRVNGKIVPLGHELRTGEVVEILTARRDRGPSLDWLDIVTTRRARERIIAWFKTEHRQDVEHAGRELLREQLSKQGLPAHKITGSALLADVIREVGFRKADDFYEALGAGKVSPEIAVGKVLKRLKRGESTESEGFADDPSRAGWMPTKTSGQYGIYVDGADEVQLRLAMCCRPMPSDEIVGYRSVGRGVTIHRSDCRNAAHLYTRRPGRFVLVTWEDERTTSFVVEIQIDAWDRHQLLEDLSRAFSECGARVLEVHSALTAPMRKSRFIVEVESTSRLKHLLRRLRNTESVFDASRVTHRASSIALGNRRAPGEQLRRDANNA